MKRLITSLYGKLLILLFFFVPHIASGQFYWNTNTPGRFSEPFVYPSGSFGGFFGVGRPRTFADLIYLVVYYINLLIPILIGLAVLGFFWGIFRYGFSYDNEEEKKKARFIMLWGVIALFVMVSVWGIIRLLLRTFFTGI